MLKFNNQEEYDRAKSEAKQLIEYKHPNIVECFSIFEDLFSKPQRFIIVLENFPVNFKIKVFVQVLNKLV